VVTGKAETTMCLTGGEIKVHLIFKAAGHTVGPLVFFSSALVAQKVLRVCE
jgi:hypothetical protein